MSLESRLQQITERAKIKANFNEDLKEFAGIILNNWLSRCVEEANEGNTELKLVAFGADAVYKNNKLRFFLKNGLIKFLEEETELRVTYKSFLVKKDQKEVQEVDSLEFDSLFSEQNIFHFYVIKIHW